VVGVRAVGHAARSLGRTLIRVVPLAGARYFEHRGSQQAAGIAYRMLFSLAPLAIVLVAAAGLVLRDDQRRDELVARIVDAQPFSVDGQQQVVDAIVALASPASAIGLLGLLAFVWSASGMMAAVRLGLENALQVEQGRPVARSKLVDLALVVGAAVLVLAVGVLSVLGNPARAAVHRLMEWAGLDLPGFREGLDHGMQLALSVAVVWALYRFVPARRLRVRDALAGAVVTALLLYAISLGSSLIYAKTTELSVIYGSLTTVLVALYSVYLATSALLFGAEVAAAWSSEPGEPTQPKPFLRRVQDAGRGLFVRREPESAPRPR
jgi:membrane protein